jgi:drug/metabolite transporter (DMT)-like permease
VALPHVAILAISGLIGFVFGDNHYFRSLVILGPGRAALLASLAPPFTALLGVPVLDERLGQLAILGMALTLGGLLWIFTGPGFALGGHAEGTVGAGIVAGILGASGQAGGYVLSKLAIRDGVDPLSATVLRVAAATAGVWLIAVAGGVAASSLRGLRDRRAAWFMAGGAFLGPCLGVTLSLVALRYAEAGVAASITATYPILTLLISSRAHGERITRRLIAGAAVAFVGVVPLRPLTVTSGSRGPRGTGLPGRRPAPRWPGRDSACRRPGRPPA